MLCIDPCSTKNGVVVCLYILWLGGIVVGADLFYGTKYW